MSPKKKQNENNEKMFVAFIFVIFLVSFLYVGLTIYLGMFPGGNTKAAYTWGSLATIDSSNNPGKYSSIASSSGVLHVSYYAQNTGDLMYARSTDGGLIWATTTVDATGDVGQYSSIAVNSSGVPIISYYDVTNEDLKLAIRNNTTGVWTTQTLESTNNTGRFTSLTSTTTALYLSYIWVDGTSADLKVKKLNVNSGNAMWTTTADDTDTDGNHEWTTSIGVASSGSVYVSYAYRAGADLRLKVLDSSGNVTSSETVDDGSTMGKFNALAFNSSGNPIISYNDGNNLYLRFAEYVGGGTGSGCTGNTNWNCTTVDGTELTGQYTSMALNAANKPVITYYSHSASSANRRYAEYVGAGAGSGCG